MLLMNNFPIFTGFFFVAPQVYAYIFAMDAVHFLDDVRQRGHLDRPMGWCEEYR